MVDTKSRGYSNSGRLSECGFSVLFLSTCPSPISIINVAVFSLLTKFITECMDIFKNIKKLTNI